MIVPKSNQKTYGVVHTKNYFSFEGFCKKIDSDEIQEVDVLLDEELIDTITANKENKRIEDIYDIKKFCFKYTLEKHIEDKGTLSFQNKSTKENLKNSPFLLNDKIYSTYSEEIFLRSFEKPIDENKIKNLYSLKSIGFFITEENIENKEFITYIKRIYARFPFITFKAFYFDIAQKNIAQKIFKKELDKFKIIKPRSIYDIAKEIEIFINIDINIPNYMIKGLIQYNQNILLVSFLCDENILNTKLNELKNINKKEYETLKNLNILDETIKKNNNKYILAVWDGFFARNNIDYDFNYDIYFGNYLLNILELNFKYPSCREHMININFKHFETHGIFK